LTAQVAKLKKQLKENAASIRKDILMKQARAEQKAAKKANREASRDKEEEARAREAAAASHASQGNNQIAALHRKHASDAKAKASELKGKSNAKIERSSLLWWR